MISRSNQGQLGTASYWEEELLYSGADSVGKPQLLQHLFSKIDKYEDFAHS